MRSAYATGSASTWEVWAGGTDGRVRVWREPWAKEGCVEPEDEPEDRWPVHGSPVCGLAQHPYYQDVVATCSGEKDQITWSEDKEELELRSCPDSSIKIWTLPDADPQSKGFSANEALVGTE
ncbi:hypothetical protein BDY21DRAFT_334003 [Lineolata rhizophorae]|uniref:WD40-repeat-containing domain protein n=1 Tax=Lineolata rhizophorae TaxID=578093 RepID=A0A6A6PC51_9PEZI|nr:hypothetical protein BDY21DRAFT_334003 [Lineolata rhizophorae]